MSFWHLLTGWFLENFSPLSNVILHFFLASPVGNYWLGPFASWDLVLEPSRTLQGLVSALIGAGSIQEFAGQCCNFADTRILCTVDRVVGTFHLMLPLALTCQRPWYLIRNSNIPKNLPFIWDAHVADVMGMLGFMLLWVWSCFFVQNISVQIIDIIAISQWRHNTSLVKCFHAKIIIISYMYLHYQWRFLAGDIIETMYFPS